MCGRLPVGASGVNARGLLQAARLALTLAHELRGRGGTYGLASLCIGRGPGIAAIIERI